MRDYLVKVGRVAVHEFYLRDRDGLGEHLTGEERFYLLFCEDPVQPHGPIVPHVFPELVEILVFVEHLLLGLLLRILSKNFGVLVLLVLLLEQAKGALQVLLPLLREHPRALAVLFYDSVTLCHHLLLVEGLQDSDELPVPAPPDDSLADLTYDLAETVAEEFREVLHEIREIPRVPVLVHQLDEILAISGTDEAGLLRADIVVPLLLVELLTSLVQVEVEFLVGGFLGAGLLLLELVDLPLELLRRVQLRLLRALLLLLHQLRGVLGGVVLVGDETLDIILVLVVLLLSLVVLRAVVFSLLPERLAVLTDAFGLVLFELEKVLGVLLEDGAEVLLEYLPLFLAEFRERNRGLVLPVHQIPKFLVTLVLLAFPV